MTSLRLKIGQSVEVMWLRHGEPLPDGWACADDGEIACHHHHHSRLIYRSSHVKRCEGER